MEAHYFSTPAEFRDWLDQNHQSATEILVGLYKRGPHGPAGITYQGALDQALSYGWIDGVRKNLDAQRWTIRFTPRKPRSAWSAVNIQRVEELTRQGLMHPAGLQAFAARDDARSRIYTYEQSAAVLDPDFERQLRHNPRAWAFFQSQPPWYRRTATGWIMQAKREATRRRRLAALIESSEQGRRVGVLSPGVN
jgi:uncharacterized protein YdeI (YjbR/CyaY-like superfamily)